MNHFSGEGRVSFSPLPSPHTPHSHSPTLYDIVCNSLALLQLAPLVNVNTWFGCAEVIQCANMGPPVFYVAKIVNEDVNIAIPDFWLDKDNMCLWPTSKPEEKAKNREFKTYWPKRGPVLTLSAHLSYEEAALRCDGDPVQSDSVRRSISKVDEFSSTRSSRCSNQRQKTTSQMAVESNSDSDEPLQKDLSTSRKKKAAKVVKRPLTTNKPNSRRRKSPQPLEEMSSDEETPIIIPKPPESVLKSLSVQRNATQVDPIDFQTIQDKISKSWENQLSQPQGSTVSDNDQDLVDITLMQSSPIDQSVNESEKISTSTSGPSSGEKMLILEIKSLRRYIRTNAGELQDVKNELRDLKKEIRDIKQMIGRAQQTEDIEIKEPRHPVFQEQQDVVMPLTTVEDFNLFEKKLLDNEIRSNLILAIRAFGREDIGDLVREAWKQTMADCLLRKFTWKGQLKQGISTEKEKISLYSSKLKMVIYEAVRWEKNRDIPLIQLDKISEGFVRRAAARVQHQQKKNVA